MWGNVKKGEEEVVLIKVDIRAFLCNLASLNLQFCCTLLTRKWGSLNKHTIKQHVKSEKFHLQFEIRGISPLTVWSAAWLQISCDCRYYLYLMVISFLYVCISMLLLVTALSQLTYTISESSTKECPLRGPLSHHLQALHYHLLAGGDNQYPLPQSLWGGCRPV